MLKTKKKQKQKHKSTRTPELCLIVDLNARQTHYKVVSHTVLPMRVELEQQQLRNSYCDSKICFAEFERKKKTLITRIKLKWSRDFCIMFKK